MNLTVESSVRAEARHLCVSRATGITGDKEWLLELCRDEDAGWFTHGIYGGQAIPRTDFDSKPGATAAFLGRVADMLYGSF